MRKISSTIKDLLSRVEHRFWQLVCLLILYTLLPIFEFLVLGLFQLAPVIELVYLKALSPVIKSIKGIFTFISECFHRIKLQAIAARDYIFKQLARVIRPIAIPINNFFLRLDTKLKPYDHRWPKFGYFCILVGAVGVLLTFNSMRQNPTISSAFALMSGPPKSTQVKIEWENIDEHLASTEQDRLIAAQQLKIDQGEYVLAVLSINCGDCDVAAKKLMILKNKDNLVAVAVAPPEAIKQWKEYLGIDYRVESISQEQLESLGAVILPTIIHLKDGQAVGAADRIQVKHE